ncbi:MAG: Membrane protein involved in the export of O-antigen and teichoic acid [Rhodobacteraceae bacterium HLUCCA08]|nr:MAG: Membrane protein involved in the export of O-antigen and teichoic acid [Rhodobacteraceae bacterium HLUCCA08]
MSARLRQFPRRAAAAFRGENLKARAARSSFWTIAGTLSQQFLRLASNLILTRILFPEAFGLMAIVQVFLTGLQMFSDMGIRASIVQNDRSDEPGFLNTAWTLQIIRGVVLWLISCAIAWPIAQFYEQPLLAWMMPVVGLTALISGFYPTRIHTMSRDLKIGLVTRINVATQVVGIVAMVILALILENVWALVIGALIAELAKLWALLHFLPGMRNRLAFDRSSSAELIHFGKWIFISTACTFLVNNADRALLGKFISLDLLGIYSIGFFLANAPLLLARPMVNNVVFPLYKQRSPWKSEENRKKISSMRRKVTAGLFAMSAVLAILGDWLVGVLYDPRYALAGPIVVLMTVALMPRQIVISYGGLLLAAGDSLRFMIFMVSAAVINTTALVIGIRTLGVAGAVIAPGISYILIYPLIAVFAHRYKGLDLRNDALFFGLGLVISALALWLNLDAVQELFAIGRS